MNKPVFIAVAIAIIVALGAGAYVMNSRSSSPSTNTTGSNQPTPHNAMVDRTSLKDLIAKGSNQECTFSDTQAKTSGTVYFGKGTMRGDFNSETNGNTYTSHMINTGTDVYIWTDGQPGGFKASMDAVEQASAGFDMQAIDLNKQADYACQPWAIDSSKFDVPKAVQFTDMSSMMKMISPVPSNAAVQITPGSNACAACNNLPADVKAQCLTALSCN